MSGSRGIDTRERGLTSSFWARVSAGKLQGIVTGLMLAALVSPVLFQLYVHMDGIGKIEGVWEGLPSRDQGVRAYAQQAATIFRARAWYQFGIGLGVAGALWALWVSALRLERGLVSAGAATRGVDPNRRRKLVKRYGGYLVYVFLLAGLSGGHSWAGVQRAITLNELALDVEHGAPLSGLMYSFAATPEFSFFFLAVAAAPIVWLLASVASPVRPPESRQSGGSVG